MNIYDFKVKGREGSDVSLYYSICTSLLLRVSYY